MQTKLFEWSCIKWNVYVAYFFLQVYRQFVLRRIVWCLSYDSDKKCLQCNVLFISIWTFVFSMTILSFVIVRDRNLIYYIETFIGRVQYICDEVLSDVYSRSPSSIPHPLLPAYAVPGHGQHFTSRSVILGLRCEIWDIGLSSVTTSLRVCILHSTVLVLQKKSNHVVILKSLIEFRSMRYNCMTYHNE